MKVTADTITDEQIREIQTQALANWAVHRLNPSATVIRDTCWALGDSCVIAGIDCRMPHGLEAVYGRDARARCAAIINAREARS